MMIAASKTKLSPGRLLIDGQWVDTAKKFDTTNPATGEVLTQIAAASADDVDRAVTAARRAFDDRCGPWRKMSASERGRLIWRLADLLEKNIDEFAELETLDNGKPIFESRYVDMPMVIDVLRYYAGWATKIHGETVNTVRDRLHLHAARAGGCRRHHRSVEFPVAAGFLEAWPSARLRQHRRVEARQPDVRSPRCDSANWRLKRVYRRE